MRLPLLALLTLLAVQDPQPEWRDPELVADGGALPWTIGWDGDALVVVAFRMTGPGEATLDIHRRPKNGAWKRIVEAELGKQAGPPAVAIRKGRIDAVLMGGDRKPRFLSVDLATGKAGEPAEIAVEVEKLEDDIWPSLVEHDGALYYLGAITGENPQDLFLLKSADNGATWSRPATEGWAQKRREAFSPTLFSCGGSLHAVFTPEPGKLRHVASADGGTSWKDQRWGFEPGDGALAYAAGSSRDRGIVLYAALADGSKEAEIKSAVTSDGGRTWTAGGAAGRLVFGDLQTFRSLVVSGDRAALTTMWAPEGAGREEAEGTVFVTADGGATWTDANMHLGLARHSAFPIPTFDGKELLVAFINGENAMSAMGKGEADLLVRRRGAPAPADLSDEEQTALKEAIAKLKDEDVAVRDAAVSKILGLGRRVVPHLRKAMLASDDFEMRDLLGSLQKKLTPRWLKP